jgi:ketosteroid isomerase-like protein
LRWDTEESRIRQLPLLPFPLVDFQTKERYEDRMREMKMRPPNRVLVTMFALSLFAWSFGAQAFAADAKAEIERLERKCATAGVAGSVHEAMRCFDTSDPQVVAYDVFTPREFDGPDAVRGYFKNYFASGFKNAKIEFVYLHVITNGGLGFTYSVQHFTAIDKNGKPIDTFPRVSDVWRQRGGTWKIIFTHASFPVDPATGKADMQSKP